MRALNYDHGEFTLRKDQYFRFQPSFITTRTQNLTREVNLRRIILTSGRGYDGSFLRRLD